MPSETARLLRWRKITVATLCTGYAGYYICRSNLSIAIPLIIQQYGDQGLTTGHIGDVATLGIFFYAVGKLLNGIATEYIGGKWIFLFGMFASTGCTVLFALSPLFAEPLAKTASALQLPVAILLPFIVFWSANRFVQSMGWGGLVQIASRWFPPNRLGFLMGILTMSYLFGDALARLYLGAMVDWLGWQGLFFAAAGTLATIGLISLFTLKKRPGDLGLPEPPPAPENVFGEDRGEQNISLRLLLLPLFSSFTFWLVCLMSLGLTMIRETFLTWMPLYLVQVVKLDPGIAGMASFVFPFCGAFSALAGGWLVDRIGGRFGPVVLPSLLLLSIMLLLCTAIPMEGEAAMALTIIGLVSFFLMPPYTFCSGVMALKFGGQRASAIAAGIIDTAGYLGAMAAGSGISRVSNMYGWDVAFQTLAGVAGATLAVSAIYWLLEVRRASPKKAELEAVGSP